MPKTPQKIRSILVKNFLSNALETVVTNFGFRSTSDFVGSIIHVKLIMVTLPIAVISALIENYFGLHAITLIAFITLITMELITGIAASRARGIPLQSKRFSRFGFKLGIWMTVFFILHSMFLQYKDNSLIGGIYSWLHGSIFIYVSLEYLLSVVENLSVITGDNNNAILNLIKNSVGKYLKAKENDVENFFQVDDNLLAVLTADGQFKKVNKAWLETLGYDEKSMLEKKLKDLIHPDDIKNTKLEYEKLKTSGSITGLINRYKTKEGHYVHLSWSAKGGKNGVFYCTVKLLS